MAWKQFIVIGFLIFAGCAAPWMLPNDPPGVTKANFGRIQTGMNLEEVRSIMNSPGDLRGISATFLIAHSEFDWVADDGSLARIRFFKTMDQKTPQVSEKEWVEAPGPER